MTKIKGMDEHGMLQMTMWMIRPPLCSSVPMQMIICKEDGSPDDQKQGDEGAGIVATFEILIRRVSLSPEGLGR